MRYRFIIEGVVDTDSTPHDAHALDLVARSLHPVTIDIEPWVCGDRVVDKFVDWDGDEPHAHLS